MTFGPCHTDDCCGAGSYCCANANRHTHADGGRPVFAPHVVGLDLSLTGTGVATPDGVRLIESKGAKDATLERRATRLDNLAGQIIACCEDADLVVIEQPAYSRTQGSQHDRSGLWWLVVGYLIGGHRGATPVAEVAPSGRAKYATGKGNASKDLVLAEVVRRFPGYTGSDNNTADAYTLMAMGLDHLGFPPVDLPKTHRDALEAVRWPL